MVRITALFGLICALIGCRFTVYDLPPTEECGSLAWSYTPSYWYVDRDGDGFGGTKPTIVFSSRCDYSATHARAPGDCDDSRADVAPRAPEVCDGVDNNCAEGIDEPNQYDGDGTVYLDEDLDGYGGSARTLRSCDGEAQEVAGYWFVLVAGDCDDANSFVSPAEFELCDGIDNNCDEVTDLDAIDRAVYYADSDLDGYGSEEEILACEQGVYADNADDCDDSRDDVYPGALEICNSIDDDCDGAVDADDDDTLGLNYYYPDLDDDGYGDGSKEPVVGCTAVPWHVLNADDCNDDEFGINPSQFEYCDGRDENCSGDELDAIDPTLFFRDRDGDGYGETGVSIARCDAPLGYVARAGDCNDGRADVYPGARETCSGTDNNCADGEDDAIDREVWYEDRDGDRFGNTEVTTLSCFAVAGYWFVAGDCNDDNAGIYPGASERCNGYDDDCDTLVDDLDTGVLGRTTFYRDADGDAFGGSVTQLACVRPDGFTSASGDCDDANAERYPGATEICNDLDDDCDSLVDEGAQSVTWYRDADEDTWGSLVQSLSSCTPPSGFVQRSGDCNDFVATIRPGADEVCDGIDNDCDALVDDADQTVVGAPTWYEDRDLDGFGGEASLVRCEEPASGSWTSDADDCDDESAEVYPGAREVCNDEIDNDCDEAIDADDVEAGCLTVWCTFVNDPVFPMRVYLQGPAERWLEPALRNPSTGATLEIDKLRTSGGTVNSVTWNGASAVHEIERHPANGRFLFTVMSESYGENQVVFADIARDGIFLDHAQNERCVLDESVPQTDVRYILVP